jgi:hypothetical protein
MCVLPENFAYRASDEVLFVFALRGLGFGGHAQYHKIAEQILQILVPLDLKSCGDECFPMVNVSTDHEHDWE